MIAATAVKDVKGQRQPTSFIAGTSFDNLGRVGSVEYPTGEVALSSFDASGVRTQSYRLCPLYGGNMPLTQAYLTSATATVTGRLRTEKFGDAVASEFGHADGVVSGGGFGADLLLSQTITSPASAGALTRRTHTWDGRNIGHAASNPCCRRDRQSGPAAARQALVPGGPARELLMLVAGEVKNRRALTYPLMRQSCPRIRTYLDRFQSRLAGCRQPVAVSRPRRQALARGHAIGPDRQAAAHRTELGI